jgi:hypothetical protein
MKDCAKNTENSKYIMKLHVGSKNILLTFSHIHMIYIHDIHASTDEYNVSKLIFIDSTIKNSSHMYKN